jgi:hypothetical protein
MLEPTFRTNGPVASQKKISHSKKRLIRRKIDRRKWAVEKVEYFLFDFKFNCNITIVDDFGLILWVKDWRGVGAAKPENERIEWVVKEGQVAGIEPHTVETIFEATFIWIKAENKNCGKRKL